MPPHADTFITLIRLAIQDSPWFLRHTVEKVPRMVIILIPAWLARLAPTELVGRTGRTRIIPVDNIRIRIGYEDAIVIYRDDATLVMDNREKFMRTHHVNRKPQHSNNPSIDRCIRKLM